MSCLVGGHQKLTSGGHGIWGFGGLGAFSGVEKGGLHPVFDRSEVP